MSVKHHYYSVPSPDGPGPVVRGIDPERGKLKGVGGGAQGTLRDRMGSAEMLGAS